MVRPRPRARRDPRQSGRPADGGRASAGSHPRSRPNDPGRVSSGSRTAERAHLVGCRESRASQRRLREPHARVFGQDDEFPRGARHRDVEVLRSLAGRSRVLELVRVQHERVVELESLDQQRPRDESLIEAAPTEPCPVPGSPRSGPKVRVLPALAAGGERGRTPLTRAASIPTEPSIETLRRNSRGLSRRGPPRRVAIARPCVPPV